jgi:hypothetical protein
VTLEGPYVGKAYHDVGCSMNGDHLKVTVEVSESGVPSLPVRPGMVCSMTEDAEQWRFHCRERVLVVWVAYFEDFTFKLNKAMENGIFYWWIDGGGYFECMFLFWIHEVTFQ